MKKNLFRIPLVLAASADGVAKLDDIWRDGGIVQNLVRQLLPLLGLAVGAMIVVGGFQLITSGGSKEGVQKAKDTLTFAIWGLALAFLAWFILLFVEEFTGVNVTEFSLP